MAGLVPSGNIRELPQDMLDSMPVVGLSDGDEDADTGGTTVIVDAKTGAHIIMQDDGSAIIDPTGGADEDDGDAHFDDNLAEKMSDTDLSMVANEVYEGIKADLASRADFEDIFARAVDMLGIKMSAPSSTASTEGTVSTIYHPLLLETTVRYQANFVAEMLPADGPVKVLDSETADVSGGQQADPTQGGIAGIGDNGGPPLDPTELESNRDELAEAFEKDFNHYLTVVDKNFVPDTDRMAFSQGLFGNGFKKQYHHPLKRMPVSESIPMQDLIVSNDATCLQDAARVTHRTKMSLATLKRMQISKAYRKVDVSTPQAQVTSQDSKIGLSEGTDKTPQRQEDNEFTICETCVDLDLPGHEHKEDGERTGLPLPYLVTMDWDTQTILSIRRAYDEDDEMCNRVLRIVHFPLIPGLGFYAYGFMQLLGNTTRALTGVTRMLLDAGQFASFPGFLIAKGGSKQATTELRVNPGMAKEVDTGGKPIGDIVMRIPYTEPSNALQALREKIAEEGMRLGSASQIPVGEGRADVPVGTMMAAVEQMTKIMGAVHKRNHTAQQEELLNLRDLLKEDPQALWRNLKNGKKPAKQWQEASEFADLSLVPSSDPNVPSHLHRIMIATALIQLSAGAQSIYNVRAVHEHALRVLGINDADSLLAPPAQPGAAPPDPMLAIKNRELDLKQQDQQIKQNEQERQANDALVQNNMRSKEIAFKSEDDAANRAHQERMAGLKASTEAGKSASKERSDTMRTVSDQQHERHMEATRQSHELTKTTVEAIHDHAAQANQHEHETETAATAAENARKLAAKQPKPTASAQKPKPKPKGKK